MMDTEKVYKYHEFVNGNPKHSLTRLTETASALDTKEGARTKISINAKTQKLSD